MKVNTRIDPESKLRVHTLDGYLTKEKLFSLLLDMYAKPDFRSDMNALWDVRHADLGSVTMSDVLETCEFVKQQWRGDKTIRVAFLVGSEVDYTLATMYETLSKGNPCFNIRIFRNLEEGVAWLKE